MVIVEALLPPCLVLSPENKGADFFLTTREHSAAESSQACLMQFN